MSIPSLSFVFTLAKTLGWPRCAAPSLFLPDPDGIQGTAFADRDDLGKDMHYAAPGSNATV